MGRSVSYAPYTAEKVYYDVSEMSNEHGYEWEDFVDGLREELKKDFPSLEDTDEWLGSEDHAFLKNRFVYFGISEYCGIACLWMSERQDWDTWGDVDVTGLAKKWINGAGAKFYKRYGDLYKCGTFSNGTGVYSKKEEVGA